MGIFTLLAIAAATLIIVVTGVLIHVMLHPTRKTYGYALAHGLPTDPCDLKWDHTEVRFRFTDGSSTPGWIVRGADPRGPTVVITHGWNSCKYGSLAMAPLLARFASHLVMYDMRGHGESTAFTCRLGTTEVDDLLQVLQQLNRPDQPVILFGRSMGAGICIAATARAGQDDTFRPQIAGVIVEGPYRSAGEPIIGRMLEHRWPPYPFVWLALAYLRLRLWHFGVFDRTVHAAALRCPLLVLHGTLDPICRFESAEQIVQAAPDARLVPIEGAGHSELPNRDPQTYNRALEDFFATLAIGHATPPPTDDAALAPRPQPATDVWD